MTFKPADGSLARWRKVYGHVRDMPAGEIVTYEQLGELLGVADLHAIQAPASRVARELKRWHGTTLKALPSVGYAVVPYDPNAVVPSRAEKERLRSQANRARNKAQFAA